MDLLQLMDVRQLQALRGLFVITPNMDLTQFVRAAVGIVSPAILLDSFGSVFSGGVHPGSLVLIQRLQGAFQEADPDHTGKISWPSLSGTMLPEAPGKSAGVSTEVIEDPEPQVTLYSDHLVLPPGGFCAVTRARAFPQAGFFAVCYQDTPAVGLFRMRTGTAPEAYLGSLPLGDESSLNRASDVAYHATSMLLVLVVSGFSIQAWDIAGFLERNALVQRPGHGGVGEGRQRRAQEQLPWTLLDTQSCKMVSEVHTPVAQHHCLLIEDVDRLLTATAEGELYVFCFHAFRPHWNEVDVTFYYKLKVVAHSDAITDMCLMDDIGLVATASMDTTVALWGIHGMSDGLGGRRGVHDEHMDMSVFKSHKLNGDCLFLHKHLVGFHSAGVRALLYVRSCRLFVTGGCSKDLAVFDMLLGDGEHCYNLPCPGNVMTLLSLEAPDQEFVLLDQETDTREVTEGGAYNPATGHKSQCLSLDSDWNLSLWNLRRDFVGVPLSRRLQRVRPLELQADGGGCGKPCGAIVIANTTCSHRVHRAPVLLAEVAKAIFRKADDPERMKAVSPGQQSGASGGGAKNWRVPLTSHKLLAFGARWYPFATTVQRQAANTVFATYFHPPSHRLLIFIGARVSVVDARTGAPVDLGATASLPSRPSTHHICESSAGKRLLVGCESGDVLVLHAATGRVVRRLNPHAAEVTSAAFSRRDGWAVSVSFDGLLMVQEEFPLKHFSGSGGVAGEGEEVSSGVSMHSIVWRATSCHGAGVRVTAVAVAEGEDTIITGDLQGGVRLWKLSEPVVLRHFRAHEEEIRHLQTVANLPTFFAVGLSGSLSVWRTADGACIGARQLLPVDASAGRGGGVEDAESVSATSMWMHPATATSPLLQVHLILGMTSGRLQVWRIGDAADFSSSTRPLSRPRTSTLRPRSRVSGRKTIVSGATLLAGEPVEPPLNYIPGLRTLPKAALVLETRVAEVLGGASQRAPTSVSVTAAVPLHDSGICNALVFAISDRIVMLSAVTGARTGVVNVGEADVPANTSTDSSLAGAADWKLEYNEELYQQRMAMAARKVLEAVLAFKPATLAPVSRAAALPALFATTGSISSGDMLNASVRSAQLVSTVHMGSASTIVKAKIQELLDHKQRTLHTPQLDAARVRSSPPSRGIGIGSSVGTPIRGGTSQSSKSSPLQLAALSHAPVGGGAASSGVFDDGGDETPGGTRETALATQNRLPALTARLDAMLYADLGKSQDINPDLPTPKRPARPFEPPVVVLPTPKRATVECKFRSLGPTEIAALAERMKTGAFGSTKRLLPEVPEPEEPVDDQSAAIRTLSLGIFADCASRHFAALTSPLGSPGFGGRRSNITRRPSEAGRSLAMEFKLAPLSGRRGSEAAPLPPPPLPTLSPERFMALCNGSRIGGQSKRDVEVVKALCSQVDRAHTGIIRFEKIMAYLHSERFTYMSRQMEILFRSADRHSNGFLTRGEFVAVLFTGSSLEQLNEIESYVSYQGPTLEEIRAMFIRTNRDVMDLLRTMFDTFDADGNGTIDEDELAAVVSTLQQGAGTSGGRGGRGDHSAGASKDFLSTLDLGPEGAITFDAFVDSVGPFIASSYL